MKHYLAALSLSFFATAGFGENISEHGPIIKIPTQAAPKAILPTNPPAFPEIAAFAMSEEPLPFTDIRKNMNVAPSSSAPIEANEIVAAVSSENDEEDSSDEKYKMPTSEEITEIMKNADEIYTRDMEQHGEYYSLLNTSKEMIALPLYQITLKTLAAKIFKLRENLLQRAVEICEKYPDEALVKSIKDEAIALLASKETSKMLENFVLLITGVKLSDTNLYSEKEFSENSLDAFVKFTIVSDICDKMKLDECAFINVFFEKYINNIISICSKSNNEFLNRLHIAIKDSPFLDNFLEKSFWPSKIRAFDNPQTPFEKELNEITTVFDDELKNIATDIPAAFKEIHL